MSQQKDVAPVCKLGTVSKWQRIRGNEKTTSNYVNKNLTAQRERERETQECSQGYPLRKISLIITNKREDLSLHQFCNLNIL